MNNTKIEELERTYWKAMENQDYDTVKSLTKFPCTIAGKDGIRSVDEDEFKRNFESFKSNQIEVEKIDNVICSVVGNSGCIGYEIKLKYISPSGSSTTTCVCTSVWVLENNNWLNTLHTETELTENEKGT